VLDQWSTHRISLNKNIAEVGLTHEPRPSRQNHVIIHSVNSQRTVEHISFRTVNMILIIVHYLSLD
jgi:hypothetical protein